MKILLVLQGYPPELTGGTENSVQAIARALARAGHDPVVVAGTDRWQQGFRVSRADDVDPVSGKSLPVYRIHRDDLYYGHWHKSLNHRVGDAYREILRTEQPDVVHVHHWLRLTRDLVARTVQHGLPCVLTLHDYSASCLIHHRVRADSPDYCDARLAADPCLQCAAAVHVGTPWMSREEQAVLLRRFREGFVRELRLASTVLVLSEDQARALGEYLGVAEYGVQLRALRLGRDAGLAPLAPERRPAPVPEQGKLILGCWGTLHRYKGTDILVEAVRRSQRGRWPVELHVAGIEADPRFIASARSAAEGLPIHFHGPFPAGGLADHPVTAVHAYVSGSRARETWGVVLDEALALGLPMILPRFGAYPEHIGEGCGALYYERGRPESLAELLAGVLRDPETIERLGRQLPALHGVLPSVDQHAAELIQVYEDARARGVPETTGIPAEPDGDEEWLAAWDARIGEHSADELGSESTR